MLKLDYLTVELTDLHSSKTHCKKSIIFAAEDAQNNVIIIVMEKAFI